MKNNYTVNVPYDAIPPGAPAPNTAVDNRPTCWGTTGLYDFLVQLENVPPGQRVLLRTCQFNAYGFIRGAAPRGTHVGVLVGIITDTNPAGANGSITYYGPTVNADGSLNWATPLCTNQPAPNVDPRTAAQTGCCLYDCDSMAADNSKFKLMLTRDLGDIGVLDQNNAFVMRQAIFLNDTGMPVHMEFTISVEYDYVIAPAATL